MTLPVESDLSVKSSLPLPLPHLSAATPLQKVSFFSRLIRVLDSDYQSENKTLLASQPKKVNFFYCLPFIFLHGGCLALIWAGASVPAVASAIALYWIRMFAITGFYHRYFSHRAFKTNRFWQFCFAVLAMTSVQKGPLWWAAHHREHHRLSDTPEDLHSPKQSGFWWSQIGWITSEANMPTDYTRVKELAKFPELVFLNRFDWLVPALYAGALYLFGSVLNAIHPEWHTSGWQMLVWGFFVSTVFLFHGTSTINSLSHVWGTRRYDTPDTSRNNLILAIVTMGEGWHNNHHRFQATVHQGFYWWEIDLTYYILRGLAAVGIIHSLNPVPERAYIEARLNKMAARDKKTASGGKPE